MRVPVLALVRTLIACASIGFVVGPAACAEGSSPYGIGNGGSISGGGGQGGTSGTEVTVTTTGGNTTTTSGFPTSATTTTSGFPTSSTTTTSGFPTSSSTTSTTSSSTSSSSGTMGSPCDVGGPGMAQCQNCVACSENADCSTETLICEYIDCDCANIFACIQAMNCQDQSCVDDCESQYPAGAADFEALNNCVAADCSNTCS